MKVAKLVGRLSGRICHNWQLIKEENFYGWAYQEVVFLRDSLPLYSLGNLQKGGLRDCFFQQLKFLSTKTTRFEPLGYRSRRLRFGWLY